MSEYRTPEEDTIGKRRVDEDAQRYPAHEDPDEVRGDVGLPPEGGEKPKGAPMKREDSTENP